jgi:hypothetical protein
LWPDVHHRLATQFSRQLAPLLRPRYVARLSVYFVGDSVPAHEVGILYPDVEVVRPRQQPPEPVPAGTGVAPMVDITPAPLTLPLALPLQVRLVSVQVRDVVGNQLVTSIEIVSPTNKRQPGLTAYQQKRDELMMSAVHLLEIDLIRRGTRPARTDDLPDSPYLTMLVRARHTRAEVWPIGLRDRLPVLPVPLRHPDPDVPLDVQTALNIIYDEADYALTLDYKQPPPPPPLTKDHTAWIDAVLSQKEDRSSSSLPGERV